MGIKLRVALEEGIVMGVKLVTALLIVVFGVSWFLNDYATLRSQAARGQDAYNYLAQEQAKREQATQGIDIIEETAP
ncbi:hypothetical protein LCGC14_0609810 [marine sediment metagenome]|uniref:Uncharacterized protein n=1 Tax=marine sediment metagenome TaxID=412755 RepID=A0A0F9R828_9ZZZZ